MAETIQLLRETGTYAALVAGGSSAPAIVDKQWGYATDRDRIVVRDGSNYFQTLMTTAEGTDGSVMFLDSNKRMVEDNANFSYSSTDHMLTVDRAAVADSILHSGDTDTSIRFTTDKINVLCGNVSMIDFVEDTQSYFEVNPAEVDIDFIVNANSISNALVVLGSSGNVGVGTAAPLGKVQVVAPYSDTIASRLGIVLASSAEAGYEWWNFGINSNGDFCLDNLSNISSPTNAVTVLAASNNVGVGTAAPEEKFHVATGNILLSNNYSLMCELAAGGNTVLIRRSAANVVEIDPDGYTVNISNALYTTGTARVGVGVADPDTALEVLAATTQIKCSHDADSAITFGCDANSDGTFTFDAAGDTFMWASPNVTHGVTTVLPTNVPFALGQYIGTSGSGGLMATGIFDGDSHGVQISGIVAAASPTYAGISLNGAKNNGTGTQDFAAAEDVVVMRNNGNVRWTLEGDGDVTMVGSLEVPSGKDIFTTAFTNWTPTWAVSGGTRPQYNTTTAKFKKIGKLVFFWLAVDGDGGDEGNGANTLTFSLPAEAATISGTLPPFGHGRYNNGSTFDSVTVIMGTTTTGTLVVNSTGVALTGTDQNNTTRGIFVSGCYEAAA